jgi:hypothetical protein
MRKFLVPAFASSITLIAALAVAAAPAPSKAGIRGPCNPYTQGAWTTRAAYPDPAGVVRAWGVFFPANGRFYAMGGRTSDAAGSDILNPREYDPVGDTWTTRVATFSSPQVNNMVGGVLNVGGTDFIYVVGGSAAGQTTATAEVRQYDPVTDVMTTVATDPWPQAAAGDTLPGGGAVFGNKLYVFGGFQINVTMIATVWQFDPNAPAGTRWTLKTATLPAPRGYIPTAASSPFVYLLGGSDFSGGTVIDTTSSLRYDPVADTITTVAAIPRATGETRAVTQPFDGSIWVLGGGRVAPNPSNEVDVYLPATDAWITAAAFPTARRNFPADVDPAIGRIWAVGGYGTAGLPVTNNEQFDCVVPVELMSFGVE